MSKIKKKNILLLKKPVPLSLWGVPFHPTIGGKVGQAITGYNMVNKITFYDCWGGNHYL